jgi:hypothetical protein
VNQRAVWNRRFLLPGIVLVVAVAIEFSWAWFMDRTADGDLLVFLGLRHDLGPRNRNLPAVGEPALDCTVHSLEGQEIHVRDLVDHKPMVVEFGGFT